jgi:hypothetical protein
MGMRMDGEKCEKERQRSDNEVRGKRNKNDKNNKKKKSK